MKQHFKSTIITGVGALALMGGQSIAQEKTESEGNSESKVETIAVKGIRSSLVQATETKRAAPVIADVISSTNLGRFPDENVAESLQRVTGVQIERVRGEGSKVSIRGLPPAFTLTTMNERTIASAFALNHLETASRSFEYSALPSEFVSSLEVYKTPMASLQEGGLSGAVIVRTHSPLEYGKKRVALSAQAAHESNSGEVAPRVSGLYSDVFAEGALGVSIGAAYTERNAESHSSLSRGFRKSRNYTQNLLLLEKFEEEKERLSLIARVEYQPNSNLRIYADAFQTELDNLSIRGQTAYNFGNTVSRITDDSPEQIVPSGTMQQEVNGNLLTTKSELTHVEVRPGGRYQARKGKTTAYAVGAKYELDDWTVKSEINMSSSEQTADGLDLLTRGFISQAGYDTTLDSEMTSLVLTNQSQAEVVDPNNYEFLSFYGEFGSTIEDDIQNVRLDLTRHFSNGIINSFKFGGSLSTQEQFGVSRRLEVDRTILTDKLNIAQQANGNYSGASFIELTGAGSGDFLGAYSGPANVPTQFLRAKARDLVESFSRQELASMGSISENETGKIDAKESVSAIYGQIDYSMLDERLTGNFGVRVVDTKQTTHGIAPDLTAITYQPDAGALITIPAGGPTSVTRSYTDILPSLNMSYELDYDLIARFSASRTIARPSLAQISPSTTASNVPPTINKNNPNLDPFRSNNVDATLEWYFDAGSIVSATIFQKELVSLIESESNNEDLDIIELSSDGSQRPITEEFIVNTLKNGDGVDLKGVELTFQHNFADLPGFLSNMGTLVNYTYIDNSEPDKVTGSSRNNFNLSGYYEGDALSIRLSYTWRDKFLLSAGAQERFGRYINASGILDGNISYDVSENVSVVLEAINLLDEASTSVDGNGYPAIYEDNGRRLMFGVKASF
ncbi:TonB-dependent receptor [Catenovulum agarivorans DS-2]|uniref:TonB-dependent receptor n=1 Tax=Catenovulum agarivorans DS-2 TaxID=1328313 RepID=W7QVA3_9ALTE|nr:TonB-dependent receptor [Catenovulum agarivorans]EWH09225.1 TonB-dependent receptor [Catenovulum agarivorans DS-2]